MDRAIVVHPKFQSGRRIIAVSDIHGNLPFFQSLMEQIRLTPQDILVLVGDVLEKGRESLALLRHVMELSRTYTVYYICGNCDGLVLRFFETDELDDRFFRAGRSLIINLKYIRRVTKTEVSLSDGTLLPLPRGAYEPLNRAIIKHT